HRSAGSRIIKISFVSWGKSFPSQRAHPPKPRPALTSPVYNCIFFVLTAAFSESLRIFWVLLADDSFLEAVLTAELLSPDVRPLRPVRRPTESAVFWRPEAAAFRAAS